MKNSPGCGCCDGTPQTTCCPSGIPATGLSVVIRGLTGFGCVFSGLMGFGCFFDCAELNGTYVLPNGDGCGWSTTVQIPTINCGMVTVGIHVTVAASGPDRTVEVYAVVQNTDPPYPNPFDARVTTSSQCSAFSALLIELAADSVAPGTECCAIGASSEAEITAV